ncbi:MAG TPA: wax ester/triacylglycerol synthase family O-acyltransferase [Actinomycetota bacterium]|nr:wax ester/triacylglycerol synthase family O-acyltransferase [Actinomycetota bacterium]
MERLTAQDLSMVWPEDFGWPQDIGALAVLDGSGLIDANGRFPIEVVREHIERRLHLLPRFRQLLYVPGRGLGWPLWVDAPSFDIAEHVGVFPLRPPADEWQLLLACEELRRRRLDRSRPLWHLWFLPGLPGGRIGVFMKLHHAVADGVAGVAAFGAFLDFAPDAPQPIAPPWSPAPIPSTRDLFDDNVRRRLQELHGVVSKLAHPIDVVGQARRAWPAFQEAFAEGRAPRTSLNRPIGSRRRLAIIRSSLDLVKEIGLSHGGKVNDVLLAAVAGGLRDLLRSRGENIEGVTLRAFVPVSLHGDQPGQAQGNLDGGMVVPLPIGEPDHIQRLQLIAAETAERKKKSRPPGGTLFRNGLIQRAFLRHAVRQRFMNAYVANVPGPPVLLHLAGAPLLEVFPMVPIMGNMTLGVGALSYAGQLNITAVADYETCPDVGVFVEGALSSLDALERSVLVRSGFSEGGPPAKQAPAASPNGAAGADSSHTPLWYAEPRQAPTSGEVRCTATP